jgi:hypothetical protein
VENLGKTPVASGNTYPRKVVAIVTAFCLIVTAMVTGFIYVMFPIVVKASGVPTEADLVISTRQQLLDFRTAVNGGDNYANKLVVLNTDIDLIGEQWFAIGETVATPFLGNFDGRHYTIRNVTGRSGIFGVIGGSFFRNLTVRNVNLTMPAGGVNGIAAVAGIAWQQLEGTTMDFDNCHVIDGTITSNAGFASGIIVNKRNGNLRDCTVVNVNVRAPGGASGIVGMFGGHSSLTISGCYFKGTVNAEHSSGIIHSNSFPTSTLSLTIQDNHIDANLSGSASAGGVMAIADGPLQTIQRNLLNGSVSVTSSADFATAGGIVALASRNNMAGTAIASTSNNAILLSHVSVSGSHNNLRAGIIGVRGDSPNFMGTLSSTQNYHINTLANPSIQAISGSINVNTSNPRPATDFANLSFYKTNLPTWDFGTTWVMRDNQALLRNAAFFDLNTKIRQGSRYAEANKTKYSASSLSDLANTLADAVEFMKSEQVTSVGINSQINNIDAALLELDLLCEDCAKFPCECCPTCTSYPCKCCGDCNTYPCECPPPPVPCGECGELDCKCCIVCETYPCTCPPPPPVPCGECGELDCKCCIVCETYPCTCPAIPPDPVEEAKKEINNILDEIDALIASKGDGYFTLETFVALQQAYFAALEALENSGLDSDALERLLEQLIEAIEALAKQPEPVAPPNENKFDNKILIVGLIVAVCVLFGGLLVMFGIKGRKKSLKQ